MARRGVPAWAAVVRSDSGRSGLDAPGRASPGRAPPRAPGRPPGSHPRPLRAVAVTIKDALVLSTRSSGRQRAAGVVLVLDGFAGALEGAAALHGTDSAVPDVVAYRWRRLRKTGPEEERRCGRSECPGVFPADVRADDAHPPAPL